MRRRDWLPELVNAPPAPGRRPPAPATDRASGASPLEPTTRSVLSLQQSAGNLAVTAALRGLAPSARYLQRQPKPPPKKKPQWVLDAEAELKSQFPKMTNVDIKDYADLNPVLTGMNYKAWTQSATEIYVTDLSGLADPNVPRTKNWPAMVLRYVIHHEAIHIGQFVKAKGPPGTWREMLKHERDAYSDDVGWLAGAEARRLIPDAGLRKQLRDGAAATRDTIKALLNKKSKLKGQAREDELHADMIAATLIPSNAAKDPKLLYKQP